MTVEQKFRTSISTFLILVLISISARPLFIVGDYYLHIEEYIALCINKDKPEMHCDGQCLLRKNLQESEKDNSTFPIEEIRSATNIVFILEDFKLPISDTIKEICVSPDPLYYTSDGYPTDLLRPPIVA